MASLKAGALRDKNYVSKNSKEYTGKGTPVSVDLAFGRKAVIGEIKRQPKGGKRVPVGKRNNSFFPPKENIEIVGGEQDANVKIQRGTSGPKLAESIIELFSYLSLSQRNEVIELVLTNVCMSAIEETNRKRQVYEESQKATEELHVLLNGGLLKKPQPKNSVPSHS